jgi:hypothetical protein
MNINEAFFESKIKSKVRFGKIIETVYDLSYILIDFQAIINNLVEKNGVINKQFTYDEHGIKTAVNDIDRLSGNIVDTRI